MKDQKLQQLTEHIKHQPGVSITSILLLLTVSSIILAVAL